MSRRHAESVAGLFCWCYLVWLLVTWTFTLEQLLVGAGVSAVVATLLAPLGHVAGPWRLLWPPRRPAAVAGLLVTAAGRVVVANLRLARRVWSPGPPLSSGMVIVPTDQRSAAGLTVVGLVTSAMVENQVVDVDRGRARLQYHAVEVETRDPERNRASINAPVERWLRPFREGENG